MLAYVDVKCVLLLRLTCARRSTSSAGRMLIGFSTSICRPALARSTSIALAAISRDPADHGVEMCVQGSHGVRERLAAVRTMNSRWHPYNDPIRLCCRLQHAVVIRESLATVPFLSMRSLLVLLDACLQARNRCCRARLSALSWPCVQQTLRESSDFIATPALL